MHKENGFSYRYYTRKNFFSEPKMEDFLFYFLDGFFVPNLQEDFVRLTRNGGKYFL